jgi:hypothetical protein
MNKSVPKSTKQTLIAFNELIRRDSVVDFIKRYREFLGIPAEGLKFTEEDRKHLTGDTIDAILGSFIYLPQRIKPFPEEAQKDETTGIKIFNTLRALVSSEGYHSERMATLFRNYFFFNQIIEPHHSMTDKKDDLLRIDYLPDELSDYGEADLDDPFLLKCAFDYFQYISKSHPVALYINPEASLNQIKDFLSKNWHLIESKRNEVILYNQKRQKPKQVVADFIYLNRDLKISEIRSRLVDELGEFLDDGHISKIRNNEKKKRN